MVDLLVHIMPDNLERLILEFNENGKDVPVAAVIRRLKFSPKLRELRINPLFSLAHRIPHQETIFAFQSVLPILKSLKVIGLPSYLLMQHEVFRSLLRLPMLDCIESLGDTKSLEKDTTEVAPFSLEVKDFPSLVTLTLITTTRTVTAMFQHHCPARLRTLWLTVRTSWSESTEQKTLQALGASCVSSESLTIEFTSDSYILCLAHITPLLANSSLTSLSLNTRQPTSLLDSDYGKIVESLPLLYSLHISPSPVTQDAQSRATCNALLQIAEERPHMKSLGLFINLHEQTLPNLTANVLQFTGKILIDFGSSRVYEVTPTALLLLRICTDDTDIRGGCRGSERAIGT